MVECQLPKLDVFNLKTTTLAAVEPELAARRREQIIASSRERYATRREDVEALLRANHATSQDDEIKSSKPSRIRVKLSSAEEKMWQKQAEAPAPAVATPGRGGEHHKYLQQLIKRWAEVRGYTVAIERPILDGLGSVDVVLEKGSRRIACEVSVTTEAEHEVGNVQKCLAAGFDEVLLISSEKKTLTAARHGLVSVLSSAQYWQVKFVTPEETFSFLESSEVKSILKPVAGDANELLTAKEVEELLRIDVKTVYSYAQRGLLPYVKIQSNLRFVKSEIMKWIEERQHRLGSRPAQR